MSLESPQLDDLRFDRLRAELTRYIPVYAPEWTDFNDSDPGITLIELFSLLAEQIGYRLNRVPEKVHVELLKLLGVRLLPAHSAKSLVALILADPPSLTGYELIARARLRADEGDPPPAFETDRAISVVPCEATVFLTTRNPFLADLRRLADGTSEPLPSVPPESPEEDSEWLSVAWDGKAPKLKDMPLEPVRLFPRAAHEYLWIGLDFNPAVDAGFRGVRVTLTVGLDDDEEPSLTDPERCEASQPKAETAPSIDWLHYFDADTESIKEITGRVDDTTDRLTRSGTLRFTVPMTIGPVPDDGWADFRPETTVSPLDACLVLGDTFSTEIGNTTTLDIAAYQSALTKAISAADAERDKIDPPIPHLLDTQLRSRARGWLRIRLASPITDPASSPRVRIVSFNAVAVTQATTVTNELLAVASGQPGQEYALENGNVLDGTLELAVQENPDAAMPLTTWTEIESLDAAGPQDRVFELDRQSGIVRFGDGQFGRIVPLVPGGGSIVALTYRHGGGLAGEVGVAAISTLETSAPGVSRPVNWVAATGGRDEETLEEAKVRARKELSTRHRAVTAGDFEWLALNTQAVRVARAEVVPLRRPLAAETPVAALSTVSCGETVPTTAAGLDDIAAHGAVSVVVVPEADTAEPIPTPSFLRAVCEELDEHRLVTTEVHVVSPQYMRICDLVIEVKARPGYTRAGLQDLIETTLSTYLHVLKGGADGKGFPFGAQVHIADLIAQVFRTEGVDRVDSLVASFTRTKTNASPRQGRLVACPASGGEYEKVVLSPEENVSIDVSRFTVSTVV